MIRTPPELIKFICNSKAGVEFLPPRPKTEKNKNIIIVRACLLKCVCMRIVSMGYNNNYDDFKYHNVGGTFMAHRNACTLFYDFFYANENYKNNRSI